MKILIPFLIANVLFLNCLNAQEADREKLECQYKLSWVPDTTKRADRNQDFMLLKIGEKTSDFYSYHTYRVDSAIQVMKKNRIFSGASLKSVGTLGRRGETYHIFKNYLSGTITVTDKVFNDHFRYEEKEHQQWVLQPDKATVNGYTAQKATCTFSGRNYVAWFTTEIPVSNGPWKFGGLPGLIVKVEDTKAEFRFDLVGLRQIQDGQPLQIEDKRYIDASKSDFQRLAASYARDPVTYINENTGAKITGAENVRVRSRPYNPIELK